MSKTTDPYSRKEFDKKFGKIIKEQKFELYNNGEWSKGFDEDYGAAREEVDDLWDFIQKAKLSERIKVLEETHDFGLGTQAANTKLMIKMYRELQSLKKKE